MPTWPTGLSIRREGFGKRKRRLISKLNARPTHPPSTVFLIEFEPEARPHLTTRHFSARLHRANDIYSLSPSLHSHFPTYNLSLPADCPSLCFASLSLPSLAADVRLFSPLSSPPLCPVPLPRRCSRHGHCFAISAYSASPGYAKQRANNGPQTRSPTVSSSSVLQFPSLLLFLSSHRLLPSLSLS